jgi:hypothetical protein
MKTMVCKIAQSDAEIEIIARCRIDSFPNSFSSKLGIGYVKKMLSIYLTNENFLIYLTNGTDCIGFVTGMVPKNDFICSTREAINITYKDIFFNIIKKPWLIFHPMVLSNLNIIFESSIRRLKGNREKKILPKRTPIELKNSVGLIDIAVSPKYQGNGYSSVLLKAFESQCIEKGFEKMHLSVKPENKNAIHSYLKNGWFIFEKMPTQLTFIKNK